MNAGPEASPPLPPAAPSLVALSAVTDDAIAPDLPTLMERLERARKFLHVEREYMKLILIGAAFLMCGTMITYDWAWRVYMPLTMLVTPFVYGWINLPLIRLGNAFRNEVLPFLLRDYGRWNYAHAGSHFSRDVFSKVGFFDPRDAVGISSIITGERFGVPLQMAVLSVWRRPVLGVYRGSKPVFAGWVASMHLPDMPRRHCLILPTGSSPLDPACRDWQAAPLTPGHQLWVPPGESPTLPPALLARLFPPLASSSASRFALYEGVLWILVPGEEGRFHMANSFSVMLNEPEPYQQARAQLAEMFAVLDGIVWSGHPAGR